MSGSPFELYKISAEVRAWAERAIDFETGEVVDSQAENFMDLAQGKYEETVLDLACMHKEAKMMAESIREEEKKLAERRQVFERRAEVLKHIIEDNVPAGTKIEAGAARVGWRKADRVEVFGEVPDAYVRHKTEVNKALIRKTLKDGAKLDFAKLQSEHHVQIK